MELSWSEKSEYIGIVGRRGENETRILTFDCSSALQEYPEAEILCIMQRPGDAQPYTHDYTQDGNTITVALTAADMCRVGTFKIELRLMQGEKILKSAIYRGGIALSLHYGEPECGEAVDLLNRIDKTLKDATETAARLETSLDGVDDAIDRLDAATDSATATDKQAQENEKTRGESEKERVEAENGRILAENSRQQQENERTNAEFIRSRNEQLRYGNENQRIINESERTQAENARKTAESSRAVSENTRVQAESERVKAETSRAEAEQSRIASEETRVSAEKSRTKAEALRVQAEQRRETAETARAEAERQRKSMETSRQTAETTRNTAESGRVTEEKARVSAEAQRKQAETARADAEGKRVQAEQGRVTAEQGRVEAETKREETMAQHAEKIAELEKEVAKKAQIDDTTVSDAAPWSSQHIVDMLCPPLEESGNPVVCYPVAGSKLGVTASWEPTQQGEGTPSPDNIRPIHGRTQVNVKRCGENLLPFSERIADDYKRLIMASDALLFLSKACAEQELTLTFSVETQNIVFTDNVEDEWRKRIGFECHGTLADGTEVYTLQCWIDNRNGELTKNGKKTKTVTVTMPELVSGEIVFYAQNIASGSFVAYDFGIYAGTIAPATYTPYTGQTTTLTLPHTIYGGEVDVQTGKGVEMYKVVTLDGTESWYTWGVNANNSAVTGFYTYDINDYATTNTSGICSHLSSLNVDVWGGRNSGIGFSTTGLSRYFIYNVPTAILADTSDNSAAIASLKSYLAAQSAASTPIQVAYRLATPIPFTATGDGTIKALSGTNTILTDADALTVTGRADPIHIIKQLQAASAASAQALADVERAVTDI